MDGLLVSAPLAPRATRSVAATTGGAGKRLRAAAFASDHEFRGLEGAGPPVFRLSPDAITSHTASANSVRLEHEAAWPRGRRRGNVASGELGQAVGYHATPLRMPTVRDILCAGRPALVATGKGKRRRTCNSSCHFGSAYC